MGGAGYAYDVEPEWVHIEKVALTLPRLASSFHNYRIAQISDIHAGGWITRAHIQDVVARVNAMAADLVVITGDIFTTGPRRSGDDIATTFSYLSAKDGVLVVLGNHDHWQGADRVREVLAATPTIELRNAARTLERGSDLLTIAGVDDVWQQQDDLDQALAQTPNQGAAILIAHEPDFADQSATTGRFDLQLSGHSHGGQVAVPFYGPLRLPYLGVKYHSGLYQVGDMLQYTNRGIGMVKPYVRFNCRPEITLLTLRSGA